MLLVSCANKIKFHNWPSGELHGEYQPIPVYSRTRSISWCRNGEFLIAIHDTGCIEVITVFPSIKSVREISLLGVDEVEVASFSKLKTHKVVLGTATGQVLVFDVNKQRIVHQLPVLPSKINFLEQDARGTCLAAGCSSGKIFLYNSNNYICASLYVPNSDTLSAMCFHPNDPFVLSAGSEEGCVVIWDSNTGNTRFMSRHHTGKVTDVAFSYVEESLYTVGDDKIFHGFDSRSGVRSFSNILDDPLSAVACMPSGHEIAVATNKGRLHCYDKRQPKQPFHTLPAHNTKIEKIAFQTQKLNEHFMPEQNSQEMGTGSPPRRNLSNATISTNNSQDYFRVAQDPIATDYRLPAAGGGDFPALNARCGEVSQDIRQWIGASFDSILGKQRLTNSAENELELLNLRRELLEATKANEEQLSELINQEFLKIRMAVSREFVSMECKMNERWRDLRTTLVKLATSAASLSKEYGKSRMQDVPQNLKVREPIQKKHGTKKIPAKRSVSCVTEYNKHTTLN